MVSAPSAGKPGIFAIRDVSSLVTETHETGHELKRSVGATQLTAMGVGAIIGTGIFVVDRRGRRHRRPGGHPVVRAGRRGLHVLRAVVRRTGVVDPGVGQRLHLRLRHPRRDRRLDHRLGPDPGVRRLGRRGRGRLGRQLQRLPGRRVRRRSCPTRSPTSPEDGGVFNLPAVLVVLAITAAAGARRAGERPGQLRHGRRQAAGADVLHRRRVRRRSAPSNFTPFFAGRARQRHHRGGDHLLRLHRVRRGLDRQRGGHATRSATCRWRSSAR